MRIIPTEEYVVAVHVPKYIPQTNDTTEGGIVLPYMNNKDPVSVFKITESVSVKWNKDMHILVRDCDAGIVFNNLFIICISDILGKIEG